MFTTFQAPEFLYHLTPYLLWQTSSNLCNYIDCDTVGQSLTISEEKLKEICDDVKLQECTPFYTIFPVFEGLQKKDFSEETNKKGWKMISEKKLPVNFTGVSIEERKYYCNVGGYSSIDKLIKYNELINSRIDKGEI